MSQHYSASCRVELDYTLLCHGVWRQRYETFSLDPCDPLSTLEGKQEYLKVFSFITMMSRKQSNLTTKRRLVHISGKPHEVKTYYDEHGNILHKEVVPLMIEFYLWDVMQVIVGAAILAIPVGFTEEAWEISKRLPWPNILIFLGISVLFISVFVYYNYYRLHISTHRWEFLKRVFFTYLLAFMVVALLLTLIDRAPWLANTTLAIKRTILVAFPASMSAAVADTLK